MSRVRKHRITLFGATGFTGGLCARYLATQLPSDVCWAIAGRNQARLAAVCEELKAAGVENLPEPVVADISDQASLVAMAATTQVVATTVGPYLRYGESLVEACISQGTHYCDLTGEPEFVNNLIIRHHARAVNNAAAIVNCCGFDSVPHDAGALFTIRALENLNGGPLTEPVDIKGIVTIYGTFSGGTWQSAVTAMSRPRQHLSAMRNSRKALDENYSRHARHKLALPGYDRNSGNWLVPMPTIDPDVILRSARALPCYGPDFGYSHYLGMPRLSTMMRIIGTVGGMVAGAQIPVIRKRLLDAHGSGEGPSEEVRAQSWFRLIFTGRHGKHTVTCEVSGGDPGYDETSRILGEMAMGLALDENLPLATGIVTPVMAMGDRLIERLQTAGISFRITD